MSTGTIFDLFNDSSRDMDVNASEFESKQRGNLPRQNAPHTQEMYEPPHDSSKAFFEMAQNYEPSSFSRDSSSPILKYLSDYGKTILKGTAKGLQKFGHMISPSGEALYNPEAIPQAESQLESQLQELLPTDSNDFFTRSTERFLESVPSIMSFPGASYGLLARTGGSALAEQIAEEFGAGKLGQAIAGITAFVGPDLTKKLLTTKNNRKLLEAGRKLDLTDKEIAPLLNSKNKQRWLSKLAYKGEKTNKSLNLTKNSLSEAYNGITKSDIAKRPLPENLKNEFLYNIQQKLFNLPSVTRDVVKQDLKDLLDKPITIESITNFWKDINANVSYDPEKYRALSILKSDISNTLAKVSPKTAKDFNSINELWSKYSDIRRSLTPKLSDQILNAGEVIGPIYAVLSGNFGWLSKIGTEAGVRRLAREMLINPRFQNLGKRMVSALNKNKYAIAKKISDQIAKEVSKSDPNVATAIQNIDWDEWEKLTKED